ncbi:flavodoxin family protein [Sunxiuqinia sp. A32]|uniref:flavodoxin family protein n=1 Tax=Sunxiuqinia sp. A32 TaxID=3461496 RepID=UPI004045CB78
MKTLLISYSYTGNNEKIAIALASELSVKHIQLKEKKPRNNFRISLDLIFNRYPKLQPAEYPVEDFELVVFIGPVWMGMAAFPFRTCFKVVKDKIQNYAYVSISGGATGPNPQLSADLQKRMGKSPKALINLYLKDLFPKDAEPTPKEIDAHQLNPEEIKKLSEKIVSELREALSN